MMMTCLDFLTIHQHDLFHYEILSVEVKTLTLAAVDSIYLRVKEVNIIVRSVKEVSMMSAQLLGPSLLSLALPTLKAPQT